MNRSKRESKKSVPRRRMCRKITEVFEDFTITIQGDLVTCSGPLANEVAAIARQAGRSFEEVLNACLRIGLPKLLAEFHAKAAKAAQVKKPKARRKAKPEIRELTPDIAQREYGVTRGELETSVRRAQREVVADRKAGRLREFKPGESKRKAAGRAAMRPPTRTVPHKSGT